VRARPGFPLEDAYHPTLSPRLELPDLIAALYPPFLFLFRQQRNRRGDFMRRNVLLLLASFWPLTLAAVGHAQGLSPENGATLFPGGALVSHSSNFTMGTAIAPPGGTSPLEGARPTFAYEGTATFAWGFRRDLQLTALAPYAVHRFELSQPTSALEVGGSGWGDAQLLLKYRFLRRDSPRGTTQASIEVGPKLPTGRTDLRDSAGALLPAGLQPGSGSTDLVINGSGTYTGVFHIKRLVADGTVSWLRRSEGTQGTRLGDAFLARFWLSYRPYQSKSVGREWFIGPSLAWRRLGRDRQNDASIERSGGDLLLAGITSYVSPHAGIVFWLALDFPVGEWTQSAVSFDHRVNFGITKQFSLQH
jgi:hypothetical protein